MTGYNSACCHSEHVSAWCMAGTRRERWPPCAMPDGNSRIADLDDYYQDRAALQRRGKWRDIERTTTMPNGKQDVLVVWSDTWSETVLWECRLRWWVEKIVTCRPLSGIGIVSVPTRPRSCFEGLSNFQTIKFATSFMRFPEKMTHQHHRFAHIFSLCV